VADLTADARAAWHARNAAGAVQSVDQFVLATRYMGDLARKGREQAAHMAELATARDALIERVVGAQRKVEAAERHRDAMQARFVQQRLSGDFKIADDQWNTLQSGLAANGS
jgi:hypothetical protein